MRSLKTTAKRACAVIGGAALAFGGTAVLVAPAASAAVTGTGWSWTQTNSNAGGGSTKFTWNTSTNCDPISGDWTGTGATRVGLVCFSSSSGWTWNNATGGSGGGLVQFGWGAASNFPVANCQPITGDWTGTGKDYVGMACYSSTSGWTWHQNTGGGVGGSDHSFSWGAANFTATNCTPITGDWTGIGSDRVGLACYSPTSGWTWTEAAGSNGGGSAQFGWGGGNLSTPNCSPITGNWGNYTGGTTHVGLACYNSTGWIWHENPGTGGGGENQFGWGGSTATRPAVIPLTGDWNGDHTTTVSLTDSGGRQLGTLVSLDDLQNIFGTFPSSTAATVQAGLPSLNQMMQENGITTPPRIAALLATLRAESNFRYNAFEEINPASTTTYGHGRGYIQLTTLGNYQAATNYFGVDFVGTPDFALTLQWSAPIAGWYWINHSSNQYADQFDMGGVDRGIGYSSASNPVPDEDARRCDSFKTALSYYTHNNPLPVIRCSSY